MSTLDTGINKHEYSTLLKWFVLILVSIVIGTNYYVYDAMSSIKAWMQHDLGFSNQDYGFLISFYSFPNTFLLMSIVGGIILDKWGIRKTGLLFVLLCVLGSLITAYGSSGYFRSGGLGYGFMGSFLNQFSPELKTLMIGRLLFGLGAETSIVVINKIMVKWFKGKELALAFAVNIAIARIGTLLALTLSPVLSGENGANWGNALWIAAILMSIGLLAFIIYMMYDIKYTPKNDASAKLAADEIFKVSDIVNLLKNKSFLYVCALCVTFYSAVFPFQNYCPDLLHNKYGVDIDMSGMLSGLIVTGTIFFTPLFGFIVDRVGKRASIMFIGAALLTVSHLILGLTSITPYVSLILLGVAFSLVPAAMWPSVALIVEDKYLGTAYGVMASIQNLGLWGFPILAGAILDTTNPAGATQLDYTWTMVMFSSLGLFGFLFASLLKLNEKGPNTHNLEKV